MVIEAPLQRVPLPQAPLLPREEMLSLINLLAVEQVMFGGDWQGARQVADTTTRLAQTVFTMDTSNFPWTHGEVLVEQETPEIIHMTFRSSLPLSYNLALDGDSGRIVVEFSVCDNDAPPGT